MVDMHECAQCGGLQDTPRGWVVEISNPGHEGVMFVPLECIADERDPSIRYRELCGQACATRRLSVWFDSIHPQSRRDPNRPADLVLQPPLKRDGTAPTPNESEAV